MSAKGKMPKDDKWKNKYKEPLGPDTSKLPNLPDGWVWVTIEQLSENKVQYGSSSKCTFYMKMALQFLEWETLKTGDRFQRLKRMNLPKNHNEFPNLLLETGDILLNRVEQC